MSTNEQAVQPEVPAGLPAQIPDSRPGVAAAAEQPAEPGPRRSLMSGRIIEPVKRKPEIRVELLIDDSGPAARRVGPRPAPVTLAGDPQVAALRAATKPPVADDRQRLADARKGLQPTIKLAKKVTTEIAEFAAEHESWLRDVAAIDFAKFKALSKNNDSMVTRLQTIERLTTDALRAITEVPKQLARVSARVEALTVADLRLPVGREGGPVGIEPIERDVRGVASMRQRLDEILIIVRVAVDEFYKRAEANGWLTSQPEPTSFIESEETRQQRAALRSRRIEIDNGGPADNKADWDPLSPDTWRRR